MNIVEVNHSWGQWILCLRWNRKTHCEKKKETIEKTNSEHFIEKEVTKVLKQMTLLIVQIDNELSM